MNACMKLVRFNTSKKVKNHCSKGKGMIAPLRNASKGEGWYLYLLCYCLTLIVSL